MEDLNQCEEGGAKQEARKNLWKKKARSQGQTSLLKRKTPHLGGGGVGVVKERGRGTTSQEKEFKKKLLANREED